MRNLPFAIAGCLHGFPVKTMGSVSQKVVQGVSNASVLVVS
jgi:hypothetical protein